MALVEGAGLLEGPCGSEVATPLAADSARRTRRSAGRASGIAFAEREVLDDRACRKIAVAASFLAAGLAAAALCIAWVAPPATRAGRRSDAGEALGLVMKRAGEESCSQPGHNCSSSKCCAWDGMQCYRKNGHWASCKASCVPGPDLTDVNPHHWSCEKLGERTPGEAHPMKPVLAKWVGTKCSKPGQDCSGTRCCAWSGMQCFAKHGRWATCKPSCVPGPDPADTDDHPWNCTALGPRTPGTSTVKLEAMKPAAWVAEKCSRPGESCRHTMCCAGEGMQCFEKDGRHAACKRSCAPGPDLTDSDPRPWTCRALGSRTPGAAAAPGGAAPGGGRPGGKPKLAAWVATKCSKPGQNCEHTRCCAWEGMRCFRKNGHWASCRYACNAGPDPTDVNNHPWNCSALGPRTPGKVVAAAEAGGKASPWVATYCSKPGESCRGTRCCVAEGEQCYEKDDHWATCRPSCSPGPDPRDTNPAPWRCTPLGFRTPGAAKEPSANVQVPGWVASHCSQAGKSCLSTRCCAGHGMQCFGKNQYWATCMSFCRAGKDERGEDWSCKRLGSRTPKPWGHPSLYCFSVLRNTGYEPVLMEKQLGLEAGVFACDGYDLACSEELTLGGVVKAVHFQGAAVGMSVDHTAGNTQLFMNVWDAIKTRGRYTQFDWTVKVDPDAVIVPDRLRVHLKPHTGGKSYIVNCDKPTMTPMMFGSLEALSKGAVQAYFAGAARCHNELQWGGWGEDFFMGKCLDLLGVAKVNDFQLISDGVCKQVNCFDATAAAFHPFKSVGAWLECFSHTQASKR